jgi:CubicO group peptidase (beta-lactamase class C family)
MRAIANELKRDKLDEAVDRIRRSVDSGETGAVALDVRRGSFRFERSFGKAKTPDSVFLLASITKPMTATSLMLLVDRKQVSLTDPVRKFIPEFTGGDRDLITVRHILTHTSGLPDQLPENIDLRKRHAPLSDFVAAVCKTKLLFKPGSKVSYQSMGLLLAQEIAQRVTKRPFRDFMRDEVFRPLNMTKTSLGLGGRKIADTMPSQVDSAPALYGTQENDWNWNSPYWRDLGAPWGGAHSTAGDISKLLEYFLHPNDRVLRPATATQMITNQTEGHQEAWGLGWSLQRENWGRACSPRTFGHYGSTGTVAWADPASGIRCVLLTTKPVDSPRAHLLGPVSDLVSQSL